MKNSLIFILIVLGVASCQKTKFVELKKKELTLTAIIPNPNSGVFELQLENICKGKLCLDLIDIKGMTILNVEHSIKSFSSTLLEPFDIKNKLADGVYIIKIRNAQREIFNKMVILN